MGRESLNFTVNNMKMLDSSVVVQTTKQAQTEHNDDVALHLLCLNDLHIITKRDQVNDTCTVALNSNTKNFGIES